MKRVCSLLLALLLTVALVGCGGAKTKNVEATGLVDALYNTVKFDSELTSVSAENYLNLPAGAQAAARMSNGTTAEEIIVVRCANEDDAKTVKAEMETFVADQRVDMERYQPQEVARLDNAVLTQRGVYVVLCVSADTEMAEKVIKEQIG